MSYCRFSSDDWQSDIYCYEHVDGFIAIHVAGSRHIIEDMPPPIDYESDKKGWIERQLKISDSLDSSKMEPIGLPHDGESYSLKTHQEAADKLKELKKIGYNVPEYAIEALETDHKEIEDGA